MSDELASKKIFLLGDCQCGKTSLLSKLVGQDYMPTMSTDFKVYPTITEDGKKINLHVWDAGTPKNTSAVLFQPTAFRGAAAIALVFDLTSMDSFTGLQAWFKQIDEYCPDSTRVVLIGTKSDLTTARTVEAKVAQDFADQCKIAYMEVSSKDGTNVQEVFAVILSQIINNDTLPNRVKAGDKKKGDKKSDGCVCC